MQCLNRYADVARALRDPNLRCDTPDGEMHRSFRRDASDAYSPARVSTWRLAAERLLARQGPCSDLVAEFAKPWSLQFAAEVTQASSQDLSRLEEKAGAVLASAAEPSDETLRQRAAVATSALADCLGSALGVQAFVALAQTLPCFLGNAWVALFQHRQEMRRLREENGQMPHAIEELLRYAGPSQAILRRNTEGHLVALQLAAANRDPAEFHQPDRLDLRRNPVRHLAFGSGLHGCLGAGLIRMAAEVATRDMVQRYGLAEMISFEERCGFGIRCATGLRVRL